MKYHRWEDTESGVRCKRCRVCQGKKAHITSCPPTPFELMLMDRIHYGNISHPLNFDGLHAISSLK